MNSKLVLLSWEGDAPLGPSNALPGAPVYPSHGLPNAPAYPSHGLPGGPALLPVFPFNPEAPAVTPPIAGAPGTPTQPIAGAPPVATQPIAPGGRFIVKWIACVGLALVPDHTLPTPPTATPK